jgi:agmatinase
MGKAEKIAAFDPDGAGNRESGIFGLPFTEEEADIIVLPVAWDVTVSYGDGTVEGPETVVAASPQLDFLDEDYGEVWRHGIALASGMDQLESTSRALRSTATRVIDHLELGGKPSDPELAPWLSKVNMGCRDMVAHVEERAANLLAAGKKVVLLGGDHSTPLGFMKALARHHGDYGILQIDAHMDLRVAYEGFTYSHASIMYNALQLPQVTRLVQVGIRDYCASEQALAADERGRVFVHTGRALARERFAGTNWAAICDKIVADLPAKVYISFDIDGLEPFLCPNTGTPVAGGLGYEEVMYLLDSVGRSGRQVIGADLVEVAPGPEGDWDGNVGARILYRLCGMVARS